MLNCKCAHQCVLMGVYMSVCRSEFILILCSLLLNVWQICEFVDCLSHCAFMSTSSCTKLMRNICKGLMYGFWTIDTIYYVNWDWKLARICVTVILNTPVEKLQILELE